jgi:glycine oxidase
VFLDAAGPRYNNRMAEHPDVLIAGGGVIGLTAAWFLAREGVGVTLVDRGDFGQQASWAGAGIIAPGNPGGARTPYDLLRAHSALMYPEVSADLRDQTGMDNGYLACGGLELPEDGADDPAEGWRAEGIAFQLVEGDDLRRRGPGLAAGLRRAYYLPGMSQVRNPRHVKALRAACERSRVRLAPGCAIRGFVRHGDRIVSAETDRGRFAAGRFLVAAGAWTDRLLAPLGWAPGVTPVRGQIALLNTGSQGVRPIVLQGKRYLVPRTDGRVLVGSTEEDAGFDARPTAGGVGGLLAFAAGLVPSLADAPLERCWAGLRPGSPDGLPFLGPVPGLDNLFVASGHFRAGIQLSPATALVLTELLLGQPTTVPLEPFLPGRSPQGPARAAFRS